jgi:hypothetical protein
MFVRRSAALAVLLLAAAPASSRAQVERPIPAAVFDVRVVFAGFGQDEITAAALAIEPEALPTRGLGFAAGLHLYPIRRQGFAIGIGGELVRASGSAVAAADDDPTMPLPPTVHRRLQGLSGNLSINFGHRDGWSYLTAGMGPLVFQTYTGLTAPEDPPRKSTINAGGGARWFLNRHIALALDVRFYLTRPEEPLGATPPRERRRLLFLSAGISVK